jgi:hypothetical protein
MWFALLPFLSLAEVLSPRQHEDKRRDAIAHALEVLSRQT